MRGLRLGLIILLGLTIGLGQISAEELALRVGPPAGINTGIQIQNVGTQSSLVTILGYDRLTGNQSGDMTATIPAGASANATNFPNENPPVSYDGSAIVSASQPIIGMVNLNNTGTGVLGAQYQATNKQQAASTLRFPLVKNNFNGKCTTFFIQNFGNATTTLNMAYSNGSTQQIAGIKPGQTALVDPGAASPAVPSNAPYALTVTAGQVLAGTVLEFECLGGNTLQATRGFTASDADATLFAPIYKNQFPLTGARNSGLQVQNLSAGAADVYVTFICSAGTCTPGATYEHKASNVAAGASATFFRNTVIVGGQTSAVPGPQQLPSGGLYAAIIESFAAGTFTPVNSVAINSEAFDPSVQVRNTATTYSAIAESQGASKLGVPLFKEMYAENTTGIQIQNIGGSSTTITVEFRMTVAQTGFVCLGTYTLSNIQIAAGASVTLNRLGSGGQIPAGSFWGGSGAIKPGCFGNATITGPGGSLLAAVVQEQDLDSNPALRLDNRNYEAFAITPLLQTQVAVPVLIDQ